MFKSPTKEDITILQVEVNTENLVELRKILFKKELSFTKFIQYMIFFASIENPNAVELIDEALHLIARARAEAIEKGEDFKIFRTKIESIYDIIEEVAPFTNKKTNSGGTEEG